MSHRKYSLNVSLKLCHIFIQTAKLILLIPSKNLRTQSTWDPEDRNTSKSFREEFESLQKKVAKVKTKQKKGYNLTSKENKALKSLQRHKKIVIKPADKGATIVIMDKARYVEEGDSCHKINIIRKLRASPHNSTRNSQQNCGAYTVEEIFTKKQAEYLKVPHNPRERRFYLLPKVHKDRSKWAHNHLTPLERPMVSDFNIDTYNISKYMDYFLSPLATAHP